MYCWSIDKEGNLYSGERLQTTEEDSDKENVSPVKRKTPEHTPIKKRSQYEC